MRRAQVVTAACAALMWTAAAGVPMAAAQSGGSGAGSGAGSTQGSNQGGSSTGATAAPTSMGDRGAQTATGTTAAGATDTKSGGNNDLQQFVQKATVANMAEIQLGQLASQHAQDPQVKQFAQMMVDDHTKALEQLRTVASSQGLQVASELDGKHQKLHDKLSKLQGAEFDRAYMDAMVDAHKDTEKLLKSRAGKNGSASASNMGPSGSTAGGNTSSTGARGTSGATGTTGSSGSSSSGASATAGASGSTSGSTETGTPSTGAPGTTATTGTTGATGSSTGASSGTSGAGSMTNPSSADEWAAMTLPKVRAHLEQARSLEDQVKQSGRSNDGNNSGASPAGGPGSGSTGSGSTSGGSTPPRP